MFFHKIFYKIGEKIRNKYLSEAYQELKKTEKYSLIELKKLQKEKLIKLIKFAKLNSNFYSKKLKDINIELVNLDNLDSIPITTKNELLNFTKDIHTKNINEKLIKSETSGSSGDALIFNRNLKWDAYHRAAILRGYSWYNIKPWDKNIYFWGFNPSFKNLIKIRIFDWLLNRYRIFSFKDHDLIKATKYFKSAKYVEGYSSGIYKVSKFFNIRKEKFFNVKMVKGTSEKIYDSYQQEIKNVFGQKMISEYGAAEAGIIAFECPYENMHIVMENVIVEEIDKKIVVTNLNSFSFPIIRYELGDYIKLNKEKQCSCGMKHYIIDEIFGRVGKEIYGKQYSYATLTLYYIFKNIAINYNIKLSYFGKQYEKGYLIIDIILTPILSDQQKISTYILKEAKKYFNDDVEIQINFLDNIKDKNNKNKDFESYIT